MAVYQKGGEADEYAALYERSRGLPGVEYVGSLSQPDLAQVLHKIDALTYPSTFAETSCIAAIEALAAGCQVLATDLGALRGQEYLRSVGPDLVVDLDHLLRARRHELRRRRARRRLDLRRIGEIGRQNLSLPSMPLS